MSVTFLNTNEQINKYYEDQQKQFGQVYGMSQGGTGATNQFFGRFNIINESQWKYVEGIQAWVREEGWNRCVLPREFVEDYYGRTIRFNSNIQDLLSTLWNIHKNKKETPSMQRLMNFNDWTIALISNKLTAFDSTGKVVQSNEGKLIVDSTAFLWQNGKLFSGEIKHTPSESELRMMEAQKEQAKKAAKINKINARIQKLLDEKAKV